MEKFLVFLFISLFCLFSLVLVTANASGQQCLEEDSGAVDLVGTQGNIGQEIQIPVRIQSAPNAITCFGFEITFDSNVLEYSNFERGDLTVSFDMLGVNQDPDNSAKLIVGGFCSSSECEISQEANGYLVRLKFKVRGGQENNYYPLYLEKLEDHIANFSSSGGCFYLLPDNNSENPDNNSENKVTIPVISPISTIFTDSIEVTITCATPVAFIRYTTDGSNPTENSLTYYGPITLTDSTTIKAQGFKSDWTQSDIASKIYIKRDGNNNSEGKNSNGHNTGLCFLTSINFFSTVKSFHPIGGRVR